MGDYLEICKTRYTKESIDKIMNIPLNVIFEDFFLPLKETKSIYKSRSTPFKLNEIGRRDENCKYCFIIGKKRRKNMFKCFHTGKAGGTIHFIMEYLNINKREAILLLSRKYNIDLEMEVSFVKVKCNCLPF